MAALNSSATFEHDVRRCAETQTFAGFEPRLRAADGDISSLESSLYVLFTGNRQNGTWNRTISSSERPVGSPQRPAPSAQLGPALWSLISSVGVTG